MSQLEMPDEPPPPSGDGPVQPLTVTQLAPPLDEASRQEQVLPQRMPAVAVAHLVRLTMQLENLPPARPGGQLEGTPVQIIPVSREPIAAVAGAEPVQQLSPVLHAARVGRGEQLVRPAIVRHGGMVIRRTDEHRRVPGAEVAAGPDERRDEDAGPAGIEQPEVAGDIAPIGPHRGEDGADVRRIVRRPRLAGQAVVHGVEMVADVADVHHRADDREMLRQRSHARVQLGELQSRDGRRGRSIGSADSLRRVRLEVPGIKMARPAAQPDEDA
jgi:hypothetical protein